MADANVPAAAVARGTPVRYSIDIRIFLATITTAMAIAFGVGVAFGPAPPTYADYGQLGVASPTMPRGESHVNLEPPILEGLSQPLEGKETINASAPLAEGSDDNDEEHRPAGQHLLMDFKNVDSEFLNSEERLAKALVEAVKAGNLTLLSYHCHALPPAGVSCVGVLLESHISFHTWPDEGVITLDLFTCGSNPLLPLVPTLEKLFGIGGNAVMQWAHELRGFRGEDERKRIRYLDYQSDLVFFVLSPLAMASKELIVSTKSPYQQIDIWDVTDVEDFPSYKDGIKAGLKPGDPRWLTTEVASPNRMLFLDGTLQSMSQSEQEYHESLVHPAMFAHPSPEHVVIVGGGEGATLREVLKHNTVKSATMIDIDEMLIDLAKQHLPDMSNCSDLLDRADDCFDDVLANVVIEDGRQWFVDRYGPNSTIAPPEDPIDVIIMDALDPEEEMDISDKLYNDVNFLSSLMTSLGDMGILVIQVGTAPNIHDPRADLGVYARREVLINMLEGLDEVAAMFVYEEAHCGFAEPHSFLLVCKNPECRKRWYAESDAIDYQIYDRIVRTKSKERALVHFDGTTQGSFQVPPKAWETVYCRREPTPFECQFRGLDLTKEVHEFNIEDEELSSFEIKANSKYEKGKHHTSVFATVDIPKGSYIMPGHLASTFVISDKALSNLRGNTHVKGTGRVAVIEDLLEYIDMHKHTSISEGSGLNFVEVGASYMIRRVPSEEETNIGRWVPPHPSGSRPVYSPVYERHRRSFDVFLVATKDIAKGEEILKAENIWDP